VIDDVELPPDEADEVLAAGQAVIRRAPPKPKKKPRRSCDDTGLTYYEHPVSGQSMYLPQRYVTLATAAIDTEDEDKVADALHIVDEYIGYFPPLPDAIHPADWKQYHDNLRAERDPKKRRYKDQERWQWEQKKHPQLIVNPEHHVHLSGSAKLYCLYFIARPVMVKQIADLFWQQKTDSRMLQLLMWSSDLPQPPQPTTTKNAKHFTRILVSNLSDMETRSKSLATGCCNQTDEDEDHWDFWKDVRTTYEEDKWSSKSSSGAKKTGRKRAAPVQYYLPDLATADNKMLPVCQQYFRAVTGIKGSGGGRLQAVRQQHVVTREQVSAVKDTRGGERDKCVKDITVAMMVIDGHDPKYSHYRYIKAPERRYLPRTLNKRKLYNEFKAAIEEMKSTGMDKEEIAKIDMKPTRFNELFIEEKISFTYVNFE
jgi:hypothetical protein